MKNKTDNLFWIKLLTLIWLAVSVFVYSDSVYVNYIEPDKQQNSLNSNIALVDWDIVSISNDAIGEFSDCFWCIVDHSYSLANDNSSLSLNRYDWLNYSCLNQSICLIAFQYFHSSLAI